MFGPVTRNQTRYRIRRIRIYFFADGPLRTEGPCIGLLYYCPDRCIRGRDGSPNCPVCAPRETTPIQLTVA
jgi:hypothetical protein